MGLLARVGSALGLTSAAPVVEGEYESGALVSASKAAKAKAPYALAVRSFYGPGGTRRRGSHILRHFADKNVWVRVAIERRKQQIAQAKWHLVRTDDPKKPPNPAVEKYVQNLFRFINPKRESLRSLLDMVVEDLLVLDAGVIEKEKTVGGQIIGLYAVDGATIAPDPNWDGTDPKAIRYRQYIDHILRAEFRNDELVYMMSNPRTNSPIGWSKVETLVQIIESELYGEEYDYDQLRQTAPAGMLDLGPGVDPDEVQKFREYYENEIAGYRGVAIYGGGDDPQRRANWIQWQMTAKEQERRAYMEWLAKKIAAVFQMDLGVFNLTQAIHKSIGQTQQAKTDEGHVALATLVAEYISREIIWEIDENHGFEFSDLTIRDAESQSAIDKVNMSIGVTTPNELRAREGLDPFKNPEGEDNDPNFWANLPYPFNDNTAAPAEEDPISDNPEPGAAEAQPGEDENEDDEPPEDATRNAPFVEARRTRNAKRGYLNS